MFGIGTAKPAREVVTYKGEKMFKKDLSKRVRKGWKIETTTATVPRRSFLGRMMFGIVSRPATEITVVYARA